MQIKAENFALLANVIKQANNVFIFASEDASEDDLAAGIFLRENLASLGKRAVLIAPSQVPENLRKFASEISKTTPVKKLIVSFNWRQNEVDKVSYNLQGENFNFVITPRNKKIDPESVNLSHEGDDPDLIIAVGIQSPSQISQVVSELLQTVPVVNIDNNSENQGWGSLNFVQVKADSVAAITAQIFERSGLLVKPETSKILMVGIKAATNNFENVADPFTFEAAAFCTKLLGGSPAKKESARLEDNIQSPVMEDWTAPKIFRTKQIPN